MKRIFTAFIFSLCTLTMLAGDPVGIREGNKIMGHVVEDVTEENIAYAAVLVVETGAGATSNEEGQFAFTDLVPGKYTLRVTAMGYETMTKEVVVSKDYAFRALAGKCACRGFLHRFEQCFCA
jgi:outer membrane receptor for ferrienterochelin and colicins